MARWAESFDMYRKIPVDLMEGTRRGSVLSYMASFAMLFLFLLETRAYFEKQYVHFKERFFGRSLLRAFSYIALCNYNVSILILILSLPFLNDFLPLSICSDP
jgi:hypothetical protein